MELYALIGIAVLSSIIQLTGCETVKNESVLHLDNQSKHEAGFGGPLASILKESEQAETEAKMHILIELVNTMKVLAVIKTSLWNSEDAVVSNELLMAQGKIAGVLETKYGIMWKENMAKKCISQYLEKKTIVQQEVEILETFCDPTKLRAKHLENQKLLYEYFPYVLRVCKEESMQLYMQAKELLKVLYEEAFTCAVDANRKVIVSLATTDYFENLAMKKQLLLKELQFVMTNYYEYIQTYSEAEPVKKMIKMKQFEADTKEIEKITAKNNDAGLEVELKHFKAAANNVNMSAGEFAANKIEVTFEEFLKFDDDSNKTLVTPVTKGEIRVLMEDFNKLLEIQASVCDDLPSSFLHKNVTQSGLFSEKSKTFGKECESSSIHHAGTCTEENNEICIVADDNPKNKNLRIADRLLVKKCVCGFQKDCAPLFMSSSRITTQYMSCFLSANENGQCRGEVGYPCGTNPLADDEFDASCFSAKCNRIENKCI